MVDRLELKKACVERESSWRDYRLPDSYLTDFVVRHGDEFTHLECDVRELFSADALSTILALGAKAIDASRWGVRMSGIGSGGPKQGNLEDDGPKLAAIFVQWARAGAIVFHSAVGDDITRAELVEG
jgi:hypothetical protein